MPREIYLGSIKTDNWQRVKMQKRLLLMNLKEKFFFVFSSKNDTDEHIGFSTFCCLKPKWCITEDRSGTHTVWACIIHQNLKLVLPAVSLHLSYKVIIEMCVCDNESGEFMLSHCDNCPGNT